MKLVQQKPPRASMTKSAGRILVTIDDKVSQLDTRVQSESTQQLHRSFMDRGRWWYHRSLEMPRRWLLAASQCFHVVTFALRWHARISVNVGEGLLRSSTSCTELS